MRLVCQTLRRVCFYSPLLTDQPFFLFFVYNYGNYRISFDNIVSEISMNKVNIITIGWERTISRCIGGGKEGEDDDNLQNPE